MKDEAIKIVAWAAFKGGCHEATRDAILAGGEFDLENTRIKASAAVEAVRTALASQHSAKDEDRLAPIARALCKTYDRQEREDGRLGGALTAYNAGVDMTIDFWNEMARAALHNDPLRDKVEALRERSDGDILELAEKARKAIVSQPAAFLIDPGSGSSMDRLQKFEPGPAELADMAARGGFYETLYTGTSVEKMIIHVAREILEKRDA